MFAHRHRLPSSALWKDRQPVVRKSPELHGSGSGYLCKPVRMPCVAGQESLSPNPCSIAAKSKRSCVNSVKWWNPRACRWCSGAAQFLSPAILLTRAVGTVRYMSRHLIVAVRMPVARDLMQRGKLTTCLHYNPSSTLFSGSRLRSDAERRSHARWRGGSSTGSDACLATIDCRSSCTKHVTGLPRAWCT